jgi:pyrroline-5-carboxylate reductase
MAAAFFELVEKQIDAAVKEGTLSRREARETLEGARVSYRNRNYERASDKLKERRRVRNK